MNNPMSANRILWFFAGAFFLYWIAAAFIEGRLLVGLFYALSLGTATMILATWLPAVWDVTKKGKVDSASLLVISIFMLWLVLFMSRAWAMYISWTGATRWTMSSPITGFIAYSVMVAGMLQLFAADRTSGAVPGQYWYHILAAVGIGALVAGVIIGRLM